jgi:pimeloyl-ACP methyl ester carboxylesterase
MSAFQVLFLPGVVLPAGPAYERLVAVLGPDVETIVKDLEVYRAALPPPDYSLDTEIAGVLREADERGWSSFHLVGYSGGGAAALACAASVPSRLLSLGLLEPAWAGSWDRSPGHERLWARYDELARSPHEEFMAAFMRLQVRPEVRLPSPPPGPPPAWMAQRPEAIRALLHTFKTYDLDRDALAVFERPVYFTLEVFPERHHFDPPHRIEPERLASSLRAIWSRTHPSPAG